MQEENINFYIIDASFVLSFLLPDENIDFVTDLFLRFKRKEILFISSPLLAFEVLNSLNMALARKRLSKVAASNLAQDFLNFEIQLKPIDFYQTFLLANELGLTFYDASYLYLSKKEEVGLLTLDKKLSENLNRR